MVSENSEIHENNDKPVKMPSELSKISPPPMEALTTVRNYFKSNNIPVPDVIEKYFRDNFNIDENSNSNQNGISSETAEIKIEQPEKPMARFDGRWHCDLCHLTFGNTFEIQNHMREIHNEQINEGMDFLTKSNLTSCFLLKITKKVIFYTKILKRKVVLWCFFSSETSEKLSNSTFHVKILV